MRLRRRRLAQLAASAILASGVACFADASRDQDIAHLGDEEAEPVAEELSVAELLAYLDQPHARTQALGPHTLAYEADFRLGPGGDGPLPRPVVDQGVVERQQVHDSLTLQWGSHLGEHPRFRLEQHNDKEAGREVIVVEERVYTHLAHRGWFERELDGDIHALWLDDAQAAAHDIVELAAPRLRLAPAQSVELRGRPALRFALSLADAVDATALAELPEQAWRRDASVTGVDGSLTLDRESGIWMEVDLTVDFELDDAPGGEQVGRISVSGENVLGELEIVPPKAVQPLPERVRLEALRTELLGEP